MNAQLSIVTWSRYIYVWERADLLNMSKEKKLFFNCKVMMYFDIDLGDNWSFSSHKDYTSKCIFWDVSKFINNSGTALNVNLTNRKIFCSSCFDSFLIFKVLICTNDTLAWWNRPKCIYCHIQNCAHVCKIYVQVSVDVFIYINIVTFTWQAY